MSLGISLALMGYLQFTWGSIMPKHKKISADFHAKLIQYPYILTRPNSHQVNKIVNKTIPKVM